jgi:hypothetical protein
VDQRFDKLEQKLDKISEDLSQIKVVQAEQAKDLKYHIKRTTQIENKLLPLVVIKHKIDGALKAFGIITAVVSFSVGVFKAIEALLQYL